MNAELLLKHFDRISEAPDAVARLRRFILDLAVRGKLVEQDPSDEPAVELLKRIQSEVQRRKQAGTYSDPRNSIELPPEKLPFDAPGHWKWARLIEVADISYGFAFESARFNEDRRGMPLIRIRDISNTDTEAYFDGEYDESYIVRQGDYLVGMDGNFSLRKWAGGEALLNQRVLRIKNWKADLVADFLAIPLQMILDFLHGKTSQTTVKHLSAKQMNGVYLPLPPLAEQHRIIAKVDELMALCDQLESAKNEREARRDQLVAASLHRIGITPAAKGAAQDESQTAIALRQAARFHLDHLPRLTTSPEHIKQLRQTILSLAIRGCLVRQDHNDEPASMLLERMADERTRLCKERRTNNQKRATSVNDDGPQIDLPHGWAWTTSEAAARPDQIITYGILKPVWVESGIPTVRVTEMKTGTIDVGSLPRCDPARAAKFGKTTLAVGDLLISKDGTIGKTAFVPAGLEGGNITQHVIRFPISSFLDRHFVRICIDAPLIQGWLSGETKGVALQGVNVGDFRRLPLPIPPLAEQHRIVAKVDELMALCDQLETQLATSETDSRRLLEAVLRDALAPAQEQAA